MPDDGGSAPGLRVRASQAPRCFVERGVALPCTAPALAGARMRPGARGRPELIVANPAGGSGVYLLPWRGVLTICRPSLYDRALYERVQALSAPSPAAIRLHARAVAQAGLAGRPAAAAAAAAEAGHSRLLGLVCQEMLLRAAGLNARADTAGVRRGFSVLKECLGRHGEEVRPMLAGIATLVAPLGIGRMMARARLRQAVATLAALRDAVQTSLSALSPDSRADAQWLLAATGDVLAAAGATLDAAARALDDVPALLGAWAKRPDAVRSVFERPDWLLDGWDWIAILWRDQRRPGPASLAELADLVPAMPQEAAAWCSFCRPGDAGLLRPGRRPAGDPSLDPAAAAALSIARNERLRARWLEQP